MRGAIPILSGFETESGGPQMMETREKKLCQQAVQGVKLL